MNAMSHNQQLYIDTLNLRLPNGLEGRANGIARQVATYLSKLPVSQSGAFVSLDVPSIKLHGGEADGVIARSIAQAIQTQVNRSVAVNTTPTGVKHVD